MFDMTPNAAAQILSAALAQQGDAPETPSLRVAAKLEDREVVYGMGFDEERENDTVVDIAGVTVLIAPRSQELLMNTTLDFVELKPGEFQFIFINPDEAPSDCPSRSSGCGSCGGNTGGCG